MMHDLYESWMYRCHFLWLFFSIVPICFPTTWTTTFVHILVTILPFFLAISNILDVCFKKKLVGYLFFTSLQLSLLLSLFFKLFDHLFKPIFLLLLNNWKNIYILLHVIALFSTNFSIFLTKNLTSKKYFFFVRKSTLNLVSKFSSQ